MQTQNNKISLNSYFSLNSSFYHHLLKVVIFFPSLAPYYNVHTYFSFFFLPVSLIYDLVTLTFLNGYVVVGGGMCVYTCQDLCVKKNCLQVSFPIMQALRIKDEIPVTRLGSKHLYCQAISKPSYIKVYQSFLYLGRVTWY